VKNAVFWDVALCEFIINLLFGGKSRLIFRVEVTQERKSVRLELIDWLQCGGTEGTDENLGKEW
jgi:hypothetical protein